LQRGKNADSDQAFREAKSFQWTFIEARSFETSLMKILKVMGAGKVYATHQKQGRSQIRKTEKYGCCVVNLEENPSCTLLYFFV